MRARVIGIGGAAAGDDGIGLAVLDALRTCGVTGDVELVTIADPSDLPDLLEGVPHVVLVDAVVGAGVAGDVVVLRSSALGDAGVRPLSSHGFDVASAIALARVLHGEAAPRDVWIVGVCIDRAERGELGLSAAVAAAIPAAVGAVLERIHPW